MPLCSDSSFSRSAPSARLISERDHELSRRESRPSGIASAAAKSIASRIASSGGVSSPVGGSPSSDGADSPDGAALSSVAWSSAGAAGPLPVPATGEPPLAAFASEEAE